MKADAPLPARRRRFLLPTLAAFMGLLILLGLGTWQLQRKAWKEGLLATLSERLAAEPVALPPRAQWPRIARDKAEFQRVAFSAEFLNDLEGMVYAPQSSLRVGGPTGPGYLVFTPARLADGGIVMVSRGFVPERQKSPATRPEGQLTGPIEIVGVMRWPEQPTVFSPEGDPVANLWFVRDSAAIAAAKGIEAAPFYVEQERPAPPGGLPRPARLQPNLPNNHLNYAVTWYGLAFALLLVFGAWMFRQRGAHSG